MLDLIKQDKSKIEKTRTIAKIHVSWETARKITRGFVEKYLGDYDPVFSNGRDMLLGCKLTWIRGKSIGLRM
jgi:hypothetical protein